MKNTRIFLALLCSAFSASTYAADLPPMTKNLGAVSSFCIVDSETQVTVDFHKWLPSTTADDLFNIIKKQALLFHVPMETEVSKCTAPAYYISANVTVTDPLANGSRAVRLEMFVDGWGLADNTISDAVIYSLPTIYVTDKKGKDFEKTLIEKLESDVYTLVSDWVLAHR